MALDERFTIAEQAKTYRNGIDPQYKNVRTHLAGLEDKPLTLIRKRATVLRKPGVRLEIGKKRVSPSFVLAVAQYLAQQLEGALNC